jgi:protein O-GlcNAc transferase
MRDENQQPSEQRALQALRLGQRRVALRIYQSLLNERSADTTWLHLQISMIYGLLDEPEAQDRHVELAAKIDPSNPSVLLDHGSYFFRNSQLTEARRHFEKVTSDPQVGSQALSNLAATYLVEGNQPRANELLDQSLNINPENRHAIDLKLKILGDDTSHFDAVKILLAEHPLVSSSVVLTLKGIQLDEDKSAASALEYFEKAIEIDQEDIAPQLERAKILSRIGRSDEAIEQLLISLAIAPDHINLMLTMGCCLQQINQIDSASYFYEKILKIEGVHSDASNLLGCCYRMTGRDEESVQIFTDALNYDPKNFKLLGNLAAALRNAGKVKESLSISEQLLKLNPVSPEGFYTYMFTQSILPRNEQNEMLDVAKRYWSSLRESLLMDSDSWKLLKERSYRYNAYNQEELQISSTKKVRVGILSAEIGAHVVGMFVRSFLQNYSRDHFHITLIIAHRRYEIQENDLINLADNTLSLHGLENNAAASAIREQNFDVIIETSGYTNNTRLHLLAFRLAPVQCHYIGYHASTGLDTIDYFIADSITAPLDAEDLFSEQIWRLPDTWLAISYHEELPVAASLSEVDYFVFGSFNQGAKFNLETFLYWAAALKSVPDSVLVIKDRSLTSNMRIEWISSSLEALGISKERLRFLGATESWQEHMSIYNVVDACLDCTSWSGSTTVFDSLSMGTPYIGIRGDTMSSRMSSSILSGYGYEYWIANSPSEFAAIALNLAKNIDKVRVGKPAMQKRVIELTNHKALLATQNLEQALLSMISNLQKKRHSSR